MKPMSIIGCICISLMYVHFSAAHQPSNIILSFDNETKTLHVEVIHAVHKIAQHFVDRITVQLNGNEIIVQSFSIQGNEEMQRACYMIPGAEIGDEVKVTGYCNISGKNTEILVISEPEQGED